MKYTIVKGTHYFLWANGTSGNEFAHIDFQTKKEAIQFCKKNKLQYK